VGVERLVEGLDEPPPLDPVDLPLTLWLTEGE
jgi:hypothetical protein